MAGATEEFDRIFVNALEHNPRDLMLTFEYGYFLSLQERWKEAARMYQRCMPIRNDVPGIWRGLATALENLGETEAAESARQRAIALENRTAN